MNLILTTDWHFTDKTPSSRVDDYPSAMKKKISPILDISEGYNAPILHAGDLTDTSLLSYSTYIDLLGLLRDGNIYTVYGQHDLLYRNKGNTPLDALEEAVPSFEILDKSPILLGNDIHLYGCSFGETIPNIVDQNRFNILVIHKMILKEHKKEWDEEHPLAHSLLENTAFDLIVSGDNHQSFIFSTEGEKPRHLINCGSLMRSKIDQIYHKPFFCVFDTIQRNYDQIWLPIQEWSEVFNLEEKVKQEEKDEMLTTLVSNLSQHKEIGLHFQDNMSIFLDNNLTVEEDVKKIINWSMVE
jgi:DNA repair exonuclease SbcCD nuclease subunit